MKRITQTRTGYGQGNCTEAAIASVLELELAEVPDLYEGPAAIKADPDRNAPFHRLWRWLQEEYDRFWLRLWWEPETPEVPVDRLRRDRWLDSLPWEDFHLIGGTNADDVGHMVVGQAGRVVWDPNPRRRGIVTAGEVVFLAPGRGRRWLDKELWDWPSCSYDLSDYVQEQRCG